MLRSCCNHLLVGNFSRLSVHMPSLDISNVSFKKALASQPAMTDLQDPIFRYIGLALFLMGSTLVLTGMYALGITAIYLGPQLYKHYLFQAIISGF